VRRVADLAGERHLHLEQPRRVLLPELGLAGVPERGELVGPRGEVVHPGLPGRVPVALAGELEPVERLIVELEGSLQRFGVLDAHGPVPVADGEREREVVGECGGRGGEQRKPGQRGGLDGDLRVADEAVGGEEDGEEGGGAEQEEADAAAEDGLARVVGDAGAAPVAEGVVATGAAAAAVVEAAHRGRGPEQILGADGGGGRLAADWMGEGEIGWAISLSLSACDWNNSKLCLCFSQSSVLTVSVSGCSKFLVFFLFFPINCSCFLSKKKN
jgi:hypothetical protein